MTYQELCALPRNELVKQPCLCVTCATCRGTGDVWVPNPMNEQFDDPEPCWDCRDGIVEACDRCQLLRDEDEDDEW